MDELPPSGDILRFSRVIDAHLQAVERLLNDLSAHGLQVGRDEAGRWWWRWQDQHASADGLGSAIIDATYWYFGLAPDPPAPPPTDSYVYSPAPLCYNRWQNICFFV